jgi:uncharacterized protein (TIGR02284 family)
MATLVGLQKDLSSLLDALLELDFDAIEAYRAAIARLDEKEDRATLAEFLADHERHTRELVPLIRSLGKEPSTGPDMKQWLTKGKVVIAALVGDNAILLAMKTNEADTNAAYERAVGRTDLTNEMRRVLEKNFDDEKRHKAWIEARLEAKKVAEAT